MEYDWERDGVLTADGDPFALADKAWFRERAEVSIGTQSWLFRADGVWGRPSLRADLDGREQMAATASGFWTTRWSVTSANDTLEMEPAGAFSGRLRVLRSGTPVGEVVRGGFLTNRPSMTCDVPLEPALAAFVLWVAFVEFDRRARHQSTTASTT